jgi:uncharacterized protein (TIGR02246 family)
MDEDEHEIERLVSAEYLDAWGRHDAAAYARTFAEDAEFTNVVGLWLKGRAEIEWLHANLFATTFKESTITVTNVRTRFIRSDVATADMEWTLSGHRDMDGNPRPTVVVLASVVATKDDGTWSIASLHNMVIPADPGARRPAFERRLGHAAATRDSG